MCLPHKTNSSELSDHSKRLVNKQNITNNNNRFANVNNVFTQSNNIRPKWTTLVRMNE